MGIIKRKVPPKPSQSHEPPLKQRQQDLQQSQFYAEEYQEEEEKREEDEEEEQEEEEEKQEEEEEKQEEEEVEEEEEEEDFSGQTATTPSTSAPDDDDESIQKLLEPLGKDDIAKLLCEAATKHRDVADKIREAADGDPAHRKIFVHGLGWDATAETLTSAFSQYGEIEDCKAVTDKITGKSKGYGFILFKTRRGARNALREPQKKIGNRMTACQLATVGPVQQPNSAAVATVAPGVSEFTQRKIYVSNVGAELDPQKLLVFFSRFGEIEEGPLGLDKVTGKPKGFCLFVYKSVEGAKRALDEPHKKFEGHVLHCQRAIDGPKQQRVGIQGNSQRAMAGQFQRNENAGFVGGAAAAGHLMAPAGPGIGFSQGGAGQMVNPAIGQALTALLAAPGGAGLSLNGILGIGSSQVVNPGGYGSQANLTAGGIGGYGNPMGLQGAYANQQQVGPGGSGRGQHQQQQQQQHGVGQYGGVVPYIGH